MTRLTTETALAILASHGADPARWPADVRGPMLALASADGAVAAALADAGDIDAALNAWLAAPVPAMAVDVPAITSRPQGAGPRARTAGWAPAVLAASVAVAIVVGGWLGAGAPLGGGDAVATANAPPPLAGAEAGEADAAFAYVFTPTATEEEVI